MWAMDEFPVEHLCCIAYCDSHVSCGCYASSSVVTYSLLAMHKVIDSIFHTDMELSQHTH